MQAQRFPFLLFLLFSSSAWANVYSGTVTDTAGHPLRGVLVSLSSTPQTATSDSLGTWSLESTSSILTTARKNNPMAPTLRFVNGHIELNQVARRVDGRWIGSRQEQNNFLVTAEPAAKISLAKIVMNQDTLNFSKAGWVHLQQVSPDSNVLHVQLQFLAPQGLRAIVGDTFTMGSSGTANTTPLHQVRISPFWIDSSLVTRSSFKALLGNDPSVWDTCAQCPVTSVTWFEAVRYCNARSLAEGREIAYDTSNPDSNQWTWIRDASGYRLPTEAEFEYAERAGVPHRAMSAFHAVII